MKIGFYERRAVYISAPTATPLFQQRSCPREGGRNAIIEIMAPPRRKTGGWIGKERVIAPRYSRRPRRKQTRNPRRVQAYRPINVPEMVYRLVNNAKHNQAREESRAPRDDGSGRFHGKIQKYRNLREFSYDSSPLHDSSDSMEESKYTKSGATSTENLSRVMDATNSSVESVSRNSSVSNISVQPVTLTNSIDTRALLKKKSLVQIINSYIKAGIEEGKRQAKKYIRKALSFGVKSGYLIPADPQGQMIHVSPTLVQCRRSDVESRKRRRRARKGEDEPFIDRRERRRETPPWDTKRKPHREPTPSPLAPPRKRKKSSASKNPEMSLDMVNGGRKKRRETVRQGSTRRKNLASKRKDKTTHSTLSIPTKEQSREKSTKAAKRTRSNHKNETVKRRRGNRGRRTKSPRPRKDEKDEPRKDSRDFSDEDEDSEKFSETEANERSITERRRSGSSREDVPRDSDISPGNPGKEVEERLETTNNQDNAIRIED